MHNIPTRHFIINLDTEGKFGRPEKRWSYQLRDSEHAQVALPLAKYKEE
jgi:hypothetical protein